MLLMDRFVAEMLLLVLSNWLGALSFQLLRLLWILLLWF